MKRKLVKHGRGTLTVSLPSKWAKMNNLKNGQFIELETSKDQLIISLQEKPFETIEFTLKSEEEWYINRTLRHLYTSGHDEIKIHYSKPEQLQLIRRGISLLEGLEIIESNSSYCLIRCIISTTETDYSLLVERILWLIQSEFDYFLEDIKKGKPLMIQEVVEINKTVNKLNNLCRRVINKKALYDSTTSKYAYWFLTSLLNISSFVLYSYDYVSKIKKIELTPKEFELVKKTRDFFYNLLLAYKNINSDKTRIFFEEREALFDDVLEIFRDKNPVITHYFLDILKEMSSIGNFILNLKINEEKKNLDD